MGFADALDREAAWLAMTPRTDGLPDLMAVFDLIQARRPRTPAKRDKQLYVLHNPADSMYVERTTNQRAGYTHQLLLHLMWPILSSNGKAEDDQLAFEQAIDQVVTVVLDLVNNHTHGAFLSVAEDPFRIRVRFQDPIDSLKNGMYEAWITYGADDFEITN